jgi:uncharacterized protein DUF1302
MAKREATGGRVASTVAMRAATALLGMFAIGVATSARADWFSENFELHGKLSSTVYFNAPSLTNDLQMDQWWNQLQLKSDIKLMNEVQTQLSFHTIIMPTYDAVYDLYPKLFGDKREAASPGTQNAAFALDAMNGRSFPGHGSCIDGAFCDVNQDTASLFTGKNNPQMVIDNIIFFGILGAQDRSRSASGQLKLGGNASLQSFQEALRLVGAIRPNLAATVANGKADPNGGNFAPIHSFRNSDPAYLGYVIGDRRSAERQLPAGLNLTDGQLKTHCFDNAHPWCWAREFYFEGRTSWDLGETSLRVGKQQVVWGKTDAFRLQDIVNPVDFGYHNVFPSLEDRRIPTLSADLVHSFGNVGPLEDVSLEFVWVFDKFMPVQVGQCGDFWAFTAACEARADFGAHSLLDVSGARVEERKWSFHNTEPGFRFEFRTPEPSIAFSLSGFWGIQDAGVARFENPYSTHNPNPAMMMFLQAVGFDALIPAFDPFNAASIQASSDSVLNNVWKPTGVACDSIAGAGKARHDARLACYGSIQLLGWIWSSSQAVVEYPRTFTLGGSMDYQIPNIDTVLRLEASYDFNRAIEDTNRLDGIGHSDVALAAIGLDRSFFIPFLNKDRTAFVSGQTFMQHIMNFDGNQRAGMTDYEWSVISTLFMQNYWRGDSIVLTNFFAYDWSAHAWVTGPSLKWILNESLYFEGGINLLQGRGHQHNIRDICKDGSVDCLGNPDSWNIGNWQLINAGFQQRSQSPFWGMESFADRQMKKRDEVWFGVTYQF